MPNQSVISVQNVTKYYGQIIGVENLSFEVNEGEIFGFLGPNGAGKTTTIRLLLQLLKPTSGRIFLFDLEVQKNSFDIRKKCGYLPGLFSVYGSMTVSEFLKFSYNLRGINYFQANLKLLLERFLISNRDLSKRIKELSHGNLQKLGIIQAFFHKPDLVILDEPTTGLDPLMQDALYELVLDTSKEGTTIFFSSHNLPEVEKLCQRVAILKNGKLIALEILNNLKKKRYRKLHLSLRETVDTLEIPDAILLKRDNLYFEFLIKGDLEKIIKAISKLPIENIVLPEPHLEEIFRFYYGEKVDV
jgi:ABC-2 type transport system ATP-binding protein